MNGRPIILTLLVPCCAALAQAPTGPAPGQTPPASRWTGMAGAMALSGPLVPGTEQTHHLLVPLLALEFDHRFFLGGDGSGGGPGAALGAHLWREGESMLDARLEYALPRREHRADELAGMGNRSGAFGLGAAFRTRIGPLRAHAALSRGLTHDTGTRADLGLEGACRLGGPWGAGAGVGAAFADRRAMAWEFGVTPEQAATRAQLLAAGDPRLRPGETGPWSPRAGLQTLQAGAHLDFRPAAAWEAALRVQATRLGPAAADSPLVRRRTGFSWGVGVLRRF